MAVVTMSQLLEAGVHFGHQTRRWNPKMKRFIFGERNGIYIIDLHQTLDRLGVAYTFVRDLVADGGTILFVGTKKQTQQPVASYAARCGMPFVNERWLGGMLTNFNTIAGRVKKMQEYERMRAAGDFDAMPKKEALILSRELEKLERNLGGIREMSRLPDAVFVIDTKKEHIAVTEANKLGLPLVAVVDTNCDPDVIDYVIPGNDDAIRAGNLMCRVIADAVDEGRFIASRHAAAGSTAAGGPAPVADPEADRRRDDQQREARRLAAVAAQEREARVAAQHREESIAEEEVAVPLQETIGEDVPGLREVEAQLAAPVEVEAEPEVLAVAVEVEPEAEASAVEIEAEPEPQAPAAAAEAEPEAEPEPEAPAVPAAQAEPEPEPEVATAEAPAAEQVAESATSEAPNPPEEPVASESPATALVADEDPEGPTESPTS